MAKTSTKKPKTIFDAKLGSLKKFMNSYPESNYINNGFYTNKNVYIKDMELCNIPAELKVLDIDKPYTKLLNVSELEDKFLGEFKNKKYAVRKMNKSEFSNFYKEMKRFKFEQIKIVNGKFKLYDTFGRSKWSMFGEAEELKNFLLEFDYDLFLKILYAIDKLSPLEVKFYSYKTFLVVKITGSSSVTIYARGVILEDSLREEVEQQKLI